MRYEVTHVVKCSSTNAVLAVAAGDGAPEGTVITADLQTAGRGRRGRTWHAPAGSSLLLSVLLRPTLPPASRGLLPLMAGTAAYGAATAVVEAASVGLKWPNDLLLDGVKAAGILLEGAGDALVLGIGMNVDWRGLDRPAGIVATSLAEHAGGTDVSRATVQAALLDALAAEYALMQRDPAAVLRRYIERCTTLGRQVRIYPVGAQTPLDGAGTEEGELVTAVSLTPEGHLRVRDGSGQHRTVQAGDVEHVR